MRIMIGLGGGRAEFLWGNFPKTSVLNIEKQIGG
jgi:hypothetical protein